MSQPADRPLRGPYAITPDALCAVPAMLLAAAAAALRGGAVLLQYRDKHSDPVARRTNARALVALCRAHGAGLIINDDIDLAHEVEADGVHLGTADGSIARARALLGPAAIIGASCGPSLQRAHAAAAAGASYVAFGRFFPSRSKPDAPQADPEVLRRARHELDLPICAIGGITPVNGAALIMAGAQLLAAIEGAFVDGFPNNVEHAVRDFSRLFDRDTFSCGAPLETGRWNPETSDP